MRPFRALVVAEVRDKRYTGSIVERDIEDLPAGDVLIRVRYSSLNYKDALSAAGNRGVTRHYPHTPGIDAAGTIEESADPAWRPGDPVLVTGYDLGMNTSGGFGQYIRVPAGWVVPLPAGLSLKESMIFGTAGFTAGMSVSSLVASVRPEDGEILVTGASGGVGSIAVAILARLGYSVIAVSGKPESHDFLTDLGASGIIGREEAAETSARPLLNGRWAGVVDTVGGALLSTAIRSTRPFGTVTCCGNVASPDLPMTVFPFILRGVRLQGIDSQNCPMPERLQVWERLAGIWKLTQLGSLHREIGLSGISDNVALILQGRQQGRVLINLDLE
ncbi:MAG: YhdH/YhfP family quinone oxidoreductase [Desulfocapsaceae bacterium]|nr:YhdH/YhfP family quinone oxidoreductase [Desulfocapsaceae bacterium]